MSILIHIEMPEYGVLVLKIDKNGNVCTTARNDYKKYNAIEVPSHGRLIDADAIKSLVQNDWENNLLSNGDWIMFREYLKVAPTILPADPPDPAEKEVEG